MDELEAQLESSLASHELARLDEEGLDLAFDFAQGVGETIGSEVLPEIPIVKSLVALWKTTSSIANLLLLRKIVRFLTQVQTIDFEEREAFLDRLEGDDRERILDDLLLVLERHESLRKAEIQGRLFAALIRGQLTSREYLDLTHATSAMNIDAVGDLGRFYADQLSMDHGNAQLIYSFAFLQLVGIDNSALGTYGGGKPEAKKVRLGQLFVDIVLQ